MKVLTLKRKFILGIIAIYFIAALWDGHWFAAMVLAGFAYWYANKPYSHNSHLNASSSINQVADDNSEIDNYKPTPAGFNQMSSSGSAIWTDYDEHIDNIE